MEERQAKIAKVHRFFEFKFQGSETENSISDYVFPENLTSSGAATAIYEREFPSMLEGAGQEGARGGGGSGGATKEVSGVGLGVAMAVAVGTSSILL
ncbi:hypothetical protein CDL15_Pgr006728 [Punica granatum]|uniref:Uncharacterized protein n=1 Tax=Punica granatum TaxID=22663 RepID=A0A218X7D2_PUNGR|nr:hypothetical protein CDL15_Pgr006728 [Punica granatum]